jgi:hypothetical protein
MTESPLQTNKVWAVMLYSNSAEVRCANVARMGNLIEWRTVVICPIRALTWFADPKLLPFFHFSPVSGAAIPLEITYDWVEILPANCALTDFYPTEGSRNRL